MNLPTLPTIIRAANGTMTDRSGTITTANASQALTGRLVGRKYFYFQNTSDTDMRIDENTAAVLTQPSILVPAGGSYCMQSAFVSSGAWNVICSASGKEFICKEA